MPITETREVLFQEDNDGQGPMVEEVHWPDGWRRFWKPLNAQVLDTFIADGVSEVFLAYRGCWDPRNLYRDMFPNQKHKNT